MDEKKKLLFDKLANASIVIVGYEFLFMLYIILNTATKTLSFSIGVVLFILDWVAIFLTTLILCAILYDIYKRI